VHYGIAQTLLLQAYQFDTLPIALKQEELQAGDLIFTAGRYNSDRKKPQKHDVSQR
jgi:hypothetical protein